jgi:hypothetical protein
MDSPEVSKIVHSNCRFSAMNLRGYRQASSGVIFAGLSVNNCPLLSISNGTIPRYPGCTFEGSMADTTRRSVLKMAGASVAALSLGGESLSASLLPGQPESQDKSAPRVMAIAAHPGDAFFAMGAPVAVATHLGGQGSFLSLSLGEKGSTTIPPTVWSDAA